MNDECKGCARMMALAAQGIEYYREEPAMIAELGRDRTCYECGQRWTRQGRAWERQETPEGECRCCNGLKAEAERILDRAPILQLNCSGCGSVWVREAEGARWMRFVSCDGCCAAMLRTYDMRWLGIGLALRGLGTTCESCETRWEWPPGPMELGVELVRLSPAQWRARSAQADRDDALDRIREAIKELAPDYVAPFLTVELARLANQIGLPDGAAGVEVERFRRMYRDLEAAAPESDEVEP